MPILVANQLTRSFGPLVAVDAVSLALEAGEVHAVVGENGAGKTTLMRLLYGLLDPDDGEIVVRDRRLDRNDPKTARKLGIGMVHQHFAVVPTMTVAENMLLAEHGAILDLRATRRRLKDISAETGLSIDPDVRLGQLPIGMQQRVEILRMLFHGAEILILDEPTSVLSPTETEELLKILDGLKQQRKAILFVSHKLPEVLAVADRITVMRRGRAVAAFGGDTTEGQLAEAMVGELPTLARRRGARSGVVALELRGVHASARAGSGLVDASIQVRANEIVGVAGVVGNGQSELAQTIAGLLPARAGRISLLGKDVTEASVRSRRALGLAYMPEDRLHLGIVATATVAENLVLGLQRDPRLRARTPRARSRKLRAYAGDLRQRYEIAAPNLDAPAGSLSGGNVQKLIIARELARQPKVLVAEEPTWGLDVRAAQFVRQELLRLRNEGLAILLISSELDEIMQLADRIIVLYRGRISGELQANEEAGSRIAGLMTGAAA
jgi:simple sugar transport system ATP-binding protein